MPIRQDFVGLVFKCPNNEISADCPFIKLRNMEMNEAVRCWYKMNKEQIRQLIQYHKACSFKKENQLNLSSNEVYEV